MERSDFDYARFGPEIGAILKANCSTLRAAIVRGVRPPDALTVSEWAVRHRKFLDDDAFPGPWSHDTAPELVEIMDALGPQDPCEEVALIKCAQSGGSASAENWIGYISDLHPGPMLFVQATALAAKAWASEKFWPMVESSPRLDPERGGTIRATGLADGSGSNMTKIRFNRSSGYVLLAGANSASGLRQRTVRYAIEDDLDQFPDDLDGQGSPESMVDARLKVWKSRGLSKRLKISTPTIKGASKIGAAYDAGDQRRYYFKCCHCGDRFDPEWPDIQWPDGEPEKAYLVPPCCGAVIENHQKEDIKFVDGWLSLTIAGEKSPRVVSEKEFQALRAKMPQSIKRGFHLEGMISRFQSWGDMASGFIAAQGDLNRLKTWSNLVRGIEFELKGGQPDHEKLKELAEQDWGFRKLPAGVLVTTLGVDVQGDGVYLELLGLGPMAENWLLDARFIGGDTDVPGEGAWAALDEYSRRGVVFPGGRTLPIDQECVDAGYHTVSAHAYCALSPRRLPVYGRAGWTMPVLGRGEILKYNQQGGKAGKASGRPEDRAYLVGTYGVKLSWYGHLRSTLKYHQQSQMGEDVPVPQGLVHVSHDTPAEWYEQVTSESIITRKVNGYTRREWKVMPGRENHWLDCRVYNYAAAEKLMLDTLSGSEWAKLRVKRHGDDADMIALAKKQAAARKAKQADAGQSYIDPGEGYL